MAMCQHFTPTILLPDGTQPVQAQGLLQGNPSMCAQKAVAHAEHY